jgi:hypothetical protein
MYLSPICEERFVTDGVNRRWLFRPETIPSSGEMLTACRSETIELDPCQKEGLNDMQGVRI